MDADLHIRRTSSAPAACAHATAAPRYPAFSMPKSLPPILYRVIGLIGNSRIVSRLHPVAYRRFGGAGVLGRNLGVLNVILTTTGHRTGKRREVPLYAFEDADRHVVVGSRNGHEREPAWVTNLRANPAATIRIRRRVREVRAYEAEGSERARLWSLVTAAYPGYELYQRETSRRIPVVVLEPLHGEV
jgi:F420H(2)-dependent quinone reductase